MTGPSQRPVEFGKLSVGVFSNQAVIADHLPDNRSIFLFNKALIIFQIRASARERNVFLLAIDDQHLIDEFSTVIAIDPQDREGEERARALEGSEDRLLAPVQEGETFRPASRHVGERQGVQVAALYVGATMSHQVRWKSSRVGSPSGRIKSPGGKKKRVISAKLAEQSK